MLTEIRPRPRLWSPWFGNFGDESSHHFLTVSTLTVGERGQTFIDCLMECSESRVTFR
ncbi:MAG: hypothetical protein GY953_41905 [bacterium]|nr:hypothetical protein [bacterium]